VALFGTGGTPPAVQSVFRQSVEHFLADTLTRKSVDERMIARTRSIPTPTSDCVFLVD
jgi:hypothetical protein